MLCARRRYVSFRTKRKFYLGASYETLSAIKVNSGLERFLVARLARNDNDFKYPGTDLTATDKKGARTGLSAIIILWNK